MLSVGSVVDIQLHSLPENKGCDFSLPIDIEICFLS